MTAIRVPREEETLDRLRRARRVVVLTGAGVSAESRVPTFRGPGGLWRDFRPEELATPEAFARDPVLVWEWYLWRRGLIGNCEPNAAHRVLARWERRFRSFTLITQNVDGLHQRAGSSAPIELHGSLFRTRCSREAGTAREDRRVRIEPLPPRCACGAPERPDVVWFGEGLPLEALQSALSLSRSAEVFLAIGTSGIVQPAASLPRIAAASGAWVLEVNPEDTPLTAEVNAALRGPAGVILPALDEAIEPRDPPSPTP